MGCKVTKNNTTSIQYIERIFVRWRGSRISGEKLLILKKGSGPLNAVFHMGGWLEKNLIVAQVREEQNFPPLYFRQYLLFFF